MANPFDYDDVEAAKNFEKNTIFGVDPNLDDDHNFMKLSLAAANMNTGLDDYDGDGLKVASFKHSPAGSSYKKESMMHYRSSSGSGLSVRGHVNSTTSVNKPTQAVNKPNFESRTRDIDFNNSLEKEVSITDVVQKSTISAAEYKKLQEELARAKQTIESLKDKWTSIPIDETIKRIVCGKPYTLDCYKSMSDKKGLLNGAVKCCDGNAIITVVIFLERTLSSKIFQREISQCPTAINHYIKHLRGNADWRKLEQFYKDLMRIEDAAMLSYEIAIKNKSIDEKTVELQKWLNKYGESRVLEIEELKGYVKNEISLLEKQRQIEREDIPKEGSDPIMQRFPRYKISLKPLTKTVEYCALYHYDKSSQFHPEEFKKSFQLTDKQYEWAVIAPLAYLRRWADMEELLTSTKWFGKKADVSHVGFENVVRVLHKANADPEILTKYVKMISNVDTRIKYAEKLSLHDVVIEAIVQLKDRNRMEAFRSGIGDASRKHVQKINDLLHNTSIKWR